MNGFSFLPWSAWDLLRDGQPRVAVREREGNVFVAGAHEEARRWLCTLQQAQKDCALTLRS